MYFPKELWSLILSFNGLNNYSIVKWKKYIRKGRSIERYLSNIVEREPGNMYICYTCKMEFPVSKKFSHYYFNIMCYFNNLCYCGMKERNIDVNFLKILIDIYEKKH